MRELMPPFFRSWDAMRSLLSWKILGVTCFCCIVAALFLRSTIYRTTLPARKPDPSAEQAADQAGIGPITVYFHERRPFYMSSDGKVHGLVADPIGRAFEMADIPFQWRQIPAKRQLEIIRADEEKSCAAGWFKTPEREVFARFSLPVYQDKPFVAVAMANNRLIGANETLDRVLSERRLQLLVKEGYSYGNHIDEKLKLLNPRTVITTTDSLGILKMIENYRADYSFMTEEEAYDMLLFAGVNSSDFKLVHFSDMPTGNNRHILCSRQVGPEIIDRLDAAIRYLDRKEAGR